MIDNRTKLFPQHAEKLITEHGLSEDTIRNAGLYSATADDLNQLLDRNDIACAGIVIPYNDEVSGVRLNVPLVLKDGRKVKDLLPSGAKNQLYIPEATKDILKDTSDTLFIIGGEIASLKLSQEGFPCIGLPGMWGLRENNQPLPDFDEIKFKGREVVVVLDSYALNEKDDYNKVLDNAIELSHSLRDLGADVKLGILPDIPGTEKTRVDDYLVKYASDSFKNWVQSLKSFSRPELFRLDLLLWKIPKDTPKEEIPLALKPLLEAAAKLQKGIGEQYLSTKVRAHFELKTRDVENIIKLLKDVRRNAERNGQRGTAGSSDGYLVDSDGFFCRLENQGGVPIPVRLANFDARITKEVIEDDGIDQNRLCIYIIEGTTKNQVLPEITVPASSFSAMNWMHQWGPGAIIEPGYGVKGYLRHGIQVTSNPETVTKYTHTGWLDLNDNMVFLTARGVIGGKGISVRLPGELERYSLPPIPENEIRSIRVSLSFVLIGKKSITLPLLAAAYLTPLTSLLTPKPNFAFYLHGPTGTFKTTLAVLCLSHFGEFDAENLSNFEDTPNQLEKTAFILKDVLMALDDKHPSSRLMDSRQKEAIAERLIRSYSNRTGRARLNPDTSDKGRYEPRGSLLISAEEIISVKSTLARICLVEIDEGDIDIEKLTRIQRRTLVLPHAMSSYINWIRDNIGRIQKFFSEFFPNLRTAAAKQGLRHPRIAEQVAFLQISMEIMTKWAMERGAISNKLATQLSEEGWGNFMVNARKLELRIKEEDPVDRFIEIVRTIIFQGGFSLARTLEVINYKGYFNLRDESSKIIGYYDKDYMYFLPSALWDAIQRYCRNEGTDYRWNKPALYRQLRERKIIVARSIENTVTERINGKSTRVLKAHTNKLLTLGQKKVSGRDN